MTLIISEISHYGIAMVADNAMALRITSPPEAHVFRGFKGMDKLQYDDDLGIGISMWGVGSVVISNKHNFIDSWLKSFRTKHRHATSIAEFVEAMRQELKRSFGSLEEPLGFHVGGYTKVNGSNLPVIYHVRNADGDFNHYEIHEFVADKIGPLTSAEIDAYTATTKYPPHVRNGEYATFSHYYTIFEIVKEDVRKTGRDFEIPHASLEGRIRYLAAWVKFTSDLYHASRQPRIIGNEVSALGLRSNGRPLRETL